MRTFRPILGRPHTYCQNNVAILFMLSRPNARSPWAVRTIYDELRCRDTTALKHLMSGYVVSPACSAVAQKLPSIPALCAALTSKVRIMHGGLFGGSSLQRRSGSQANTALVTARCRATRETATMRHPYSPALLL